MTAELAAYLAGVVTAGAGFGLMNLFQRARRARRAHIRAQLRQHVNQTRHDRHEAQKARVRFVPSEELADDT